MKKRATGLTLAGAPVELDHEGLFRVTLPSGEALKAASFAALNRKAMSTQKFDAFPALEYDRYVGRNRPNIAFEPITVVGMQKRPGYFSDYFRLASGDAVHRVIVDTPENRAVLRKLLKVRRREFELEQQLKWRDTRSLQAEVKP